VVIFLINKIFQLTADEEEQLIGIDETECGMASYPEFTRTI
jgi:Amt family ammonium transporter